MQRSGREALQAELKFWLFKTKIEVFKLNSDSTVFLEE